MPSLIFGGSLGKEFFKLVNCLAHAQIGVQVLKIMQDRKLKEQEMATLLGIKRSEVSHLLSGRFNRFTTDKFFDFLKRLDQKVIIQVSHHHEGEPYQQVFFAP